MKYMARRKGIAMIELIFAIVVIGIVLMSVPNLVWTAGKSGYVGIQQEAINEAASHLNMIWSYPWDERDTDEKVRAPILHVSKYWKNIACFLCRDGDGYRLPSDYHFQLFLHRSKATGWQYDSCYKYDKS